MLRNQRYTISPELVNNSAVGKDRFTANENNIDIWQVNGDCAIKNNNAMYTCLFAKLFDCVSSVAWLTLSCDHRYLEASITCMFEDSKYDA